METIYTVKNFRRFNHEGATVQFSPITILTGSNSSGKSSIVKSLVTFEQYLCKIADKYKKLNKFTPEQFALDFSNSQLGLGRFNIAFNNTAPIGDKMVFEYSVESKLLGDRIFVEYAFVENCRDRLDNGRLSDVVIYNSNRDVLLHVDYNSTVPVVKHENLISLVNAFLHFAMYSISCSCEYKLNYLSKQTKALQLSYKEKSEKLHDIIKQIETLHLQSTFDNRCQYSSWMYQNGFLSEFPYSGKDFGTIKSFVNWSSNSFKDYYLDKEVDVEAIINEAICHFICEMFCCNYFPDKMSNLVDDFLFSILLGEDEKYRGKECSFAMYQVFTKFIKYVFDEILIPDFVEKLKYIGTSRIALKRLYPIDDTSDDLGHLFKQYLEKEKLTETYSEYSQVFDYIPGTFMQKWLRKFNVAYKIDIRNNSEGQGIEVRLYTSKDDEHGNLLADEGYGITQLLALILNIEVAILNGPTYKHRPIRGEFIENLNKDNLSLSPYPPRCPQTLTIEEPEVHLHPKYQSLIADMLLEAYKWYNINFVVETHSEYLIRRSQVLVAQMGFQSNAEADEHSPFRTIYVPDNERPYNLFYRKDGKFAESFGPGFFDEASRLMFEIL